MAPSAFSAMNSGCSARQAVHHEAKTLTSGTSPARSAVDRPADRPSTAGRSNAGTGLPTSADGIFRGLRVRLHASIAPTMIDDASGRMTSRRDRKRVVSGKSVSVSVDQGGRRNIKKQKQKKQTRTRK